MEAQRKTQNQGKPHVPEKLTPTPAVNLRVDIDCFELAQGLEGKVCPSVGKGEKHPKQFPLDASGRGDDRRQQGVTQRDNDCVSKAQKAEPPPRLPAIGHL